MEDGENKDHPIDTNRPKKVNNDWAFCYLGMVTSLFGFILLFQSCMEIRLNDFSFYAYSGWDMASSPVFSSTGALSAYSGFQKYFPLIASLSSFLAFMMFIEGRNKKPNFVIEALSLFMIILPIFTIAFIDPSSAGEIKRTAGWTNYGMIFAGCFNFVSFFMCRRYWSSMPE